MYVPGFVQARREAIGTSPVTFTVNCFGNEDAVVQATEDRLFLFPMEADLDSAKSAVTHGLYLEEVSASRFFLERSHGRGMYQLLPSE